MNPYQDGWTVLTNSKDQRLKLWDIRMFTKESAARRFERDVVESAWDYRWEEIPERYDSKIVKSREDDTSVMTLAGHTVSQTLIRARFSPDYTQNRYDSYRMN